MRRVAQRSLRRRLTAQLLAGAALLSFLLYGAVRYLAEEAAQRTYDNVLAASVVSIIDAVRIERGEIKIDIPYSAFSMLGAISEDRVFYRVLVGDETVTGYADLPLPPPPAPPERTSYMSADYRGEEVRIVASTRLLTMGGEPVEVIALIAQTTGGQAAITDNVSNAAALIGLGFFVGATLLTWLTAESVLAPIRRLAGAVERRGPSDLRPMRSETPKELAPLAIALNQLMTRLGAGISRTEDFIAEAAHRIRTPLAIVRTKAEIALRRADAPEDRQSAREIITAVDAASRSAGQLLDHAMVRLRRDQQMRERVDLFELAVAVVESMRPAAELRDITLPTPQRPAAPCLLDGDPVLLEGALRNLIDNAVKYSDPDGIVRVTLTHGQDAARIRIRDNGRGFGGAAPEALLKRFARGENAEGVVGSGLGLTIAAEVAAAHGGRIELFEPRTEPGACVELYLPFAP